MNDTILVKESGFNMILQYLAGLTYIKKKENFL